MPRRKPFVTRTAARSAAKSTVRLHRRHEHAHLYHTNRWRVASERFRSTPEGCYCRPCRARGVIVASKVVDHIKPISQGGSFWDPENWQPLCASCHLAKLSEERTGKPARKRMGCGVDGLPLPGSGHWWCDDE